MQSAARQYFKQCVSIGKVNNFGFMLANAPTDDAHFIATLRELHARHTQGYVID